ncbi:hypothetical protein [Amycolatopsis sp. NPDC059657]|uniref:hypothetical protein n=1 Tax=Amycolatopsis sp. NPDC059657 TaxID=3346899 RepID=UPI00366FB1FB
MKRISRAARITAATGAAAFGVLGFTGTASATQEAVSPFSVCSPAGCDAQRVDGTVEYLSGQNRARIVVRLTDTTPPENFLIARLELGGWLGSQSWTLQSNGQSKQFVLTSEEIAPASLGVSACTAPPSACNKVSVPVR